MTRLFTFGCSFTRYLWPTWADILGRQFSEHQNWGMPGGGNFFIMASLTEAIRTQSISQHDTVGIMWTSIGREDRWVDWPDTRGWLGLGSIYNKQSYYSKDYLKKFGDPITYLMRDMPVIASVQSMLKNIGCTYYMLNMAPFLLADDAGNSWVYVEYPDYVEKLHPVEHLYQDVFKTIKPSMMEVIFKGDWNHFGKRQDDHPRPAEHLQYLNQVLPEVSINDTTKEWIMAEQKKVSESKPFTKLYEAPPVNRI